MMRKYQVRFGGGSVEKCPQGQLATFPPYFIQVHDASGQTTLHRWLLLDGLTGSEVVEIAEEHGVQLPEAHSLCAMLDLPFEQWNPVVLGQ